MSYSTIYRIEKDKTFSEETIELSNGWGFGPQVWNAVCERYLGNKMAWASESGAKELWPLYQDEKLPLHWRVALGATYDKAVISYESREEVAALLTKFYEETKIEGYVNHIPAIVKILEELPECYGICMQQTSVSDTIWKKWDEEKEEYEWKPINNETHFLVLETVK